MWDLPEPGIEPMPLALASGLLIAGWEVPQLMIFLQFLNVYLEKTYLATGGMLTLVPYPLEWKLQKLLLCTKIGTWKQDCLPRGDAELNATSPLNSAVGCWWLKLQQLSQPSLEPVTGAIQHISWQLVAVDLANAFFSILICKALQRRCFLFFPPTGASNLPSVLPQGCVSSPAWL